MAIYGPLEIHRDGQPTGLWHYCAITANAEHVYAVGDCSPFEPCPDCQMPLQYTCKTCKGRFAITKENPCPGHPTPEEARAHYVEFLVRKATFVLDTEENRNMAAVLRRCKLCREWTCGIATVTGQLVHSFPLCLKHSNVEGVRACLEDRSVSGPAPMRSPASVFAKLPKLDPRPE